MRLARLEEDLAATKRRMKEIEVEWDGWYDKYRRLYARLSKREERAHETPDSPVEPRSPATPGQITNPAAMRLLGRL